jgi:hypothetical protein
MHLQHPICWLQYSAVGICSAIVHITTIQCALYCKLVAKCSVYPPVYAMSTVVPAICKVLTAPHIYALIFNCRQLPSSWRYPDNSMRVILHSWCQIQRTSSSLRYVTCGPDHIQSIFQHRIFRLQYSAGGICAAIVHITTIQYALYSILGAKYRAHCPVCAMWTVVPDIYNAFTGPHIQTSMFIWTYLRCYWRYLDNSIVVILQTWCQIERTSSGLRYVNCGPGHIQYIYSSAHSDFNIHLNLSALLLEISRQFNERYTAF